MVCYSKHLASTLHLFYQPLKCSYELKCQSPSNMFMLHCQEEKESNRDAHNKQDKTPTTTKVEDIHSAPHTPDGNVHITQTNLQIPTSVLSGWQILISRSIRQNGRYISSLSSLFWHKKLLSSKCRNYFGKHIQTGKLQYMYCTVHMSTASKQLEETWRWGYNKETVTNIVFQLACQKLPCTV